MIALRQDQATSLGVMVVEGCCRDQNSLAKTCPFRSPRKRSPYVWRNRCDDRSGGPTISRQVLVLGSLNVKTSLINAKKKPTKN